MVTVPQLKTLQAKNAPEMFTKIVVKINQMFSIK